MSKHKSISCTKCHERIYFDPKGEGETIECPECSTVNKNTHYMKESKFEQYLLEKSEGFNYIIGMQNGKKYYVNSSHKWAKWDASLPSVKKFTQESAKQYTSHDGLQLNGKPMDEVVVQFRESLQESTGNGYIAFYSGKRVEVYADTSYKAQLKATEEFQKLFPRKKIKSYEVTVKLAEKDGKQVIHTPQD